MVQLSAPIGHRRERHSAQTDGETDRQRERPDRRKYDANRLLLGSKVSKSYNLIV